jgi:ribonuclease HI
MEKIIVYTDGGSKGNPGPGGVGVVIYNDKKEAIKKYSHNLGKVTNNQAEYQAVIFALKKIKLLFGKKKTKDLSVEIRADSELLVKQLNGEYKILDDKIQPLFLEVWNLKFDFREVIFKNIPREENKEADKLVKQAFNGRDSQKLI